MELIVLQGKRVRRVEAVRTEALWNISVDGQTYQVDFAQLEGASKSLIVDGVQFEVSVHLKKPGEYLVNSSVGPALLEVLEPLEYAARQAIPQQADRGTGVVTAYMPGRVAAILVKSGQEISASEGLVVLEAMKMENDIKADHDGVVGEIFVAVGDLVEGGDRLVEVR